MRILILILSLLALPAFGQTFGQTAAFRGASIAKQTAAPGPSWPDPSTYALLARWKGDDAVTNGSGQVTNWPDSSGNSYTLYSLAAANSPLANQMQNSHLTVKFDGINDTMTNGPIARYGTNDSEIVMVWKYADAFYPAYHLGFDGLASSPRWRLQIGNTPVYKFGSSASLWGPTLDLITNTWIILDVTITNAPTFPMWVTVWTNGVYVGFQASVSFDDLSGFRLGSFYDGTTLYTPIEIAEFLIFATNLGPTAFSIPRSNVFCYLTNKYGLSVP